MRGPSRKAGKRPGAAGYETTDVSARLILLAGVGLFAGAALSIVIAFGVLRSVEPVRQPRSPSFNSQLDGGPRLEVSPSADRVLLQAGARERLEGYGWIDQSRQTARIPIDRAIAILAMRGWPDPAEKTGGSP
ncbi:hypothetical protein AB4Z52_21825 [Rhizobium sp. 2YAF20]|uniref:hypothetical protein n=1 Tax=Rhizobium sp. 2YAF20 TaxID=3233027 RepID=UPI003F947D2B